MAPKRKAEEAVEKAEKPAPKTSKKSSKVAKEPYTNDQGWTIHFPSLIYKSGKAKPNAKIAAFDMDDTLILKKGKSKVFISADDWKFFNKSVPSKLQEYADQGFKLVVFSNQGGVKSALEGKMAEKITAIVDNFLKELKAPVQVFFATQDDELRKPEPGMWKFMVEHCNGGKSVDMKQSFFVGDAAGRDDDFADSDKVFAEKVGIKFMVPEDVFGQRDGKKSLVVKAGGENHNPELSNAFNRLAEYHDKKGGDHAKFIINTYKKVSTAIANFPQKITAGKQLSSIQGIGKKSVQKVDEFLKNGTFAELEEEEGNEDAKAQKKEEQDMASKFL